MKIGGFKKVRCPYCGEKNDLHHDYFADETKLKQLKVECGRCLLPFWIADRRPWRERKTDLEGQTAEYSYCARCGRTWDKCKSHAVDVEDRGAFPLCEDCWNEITIEERKFWMNKLIDEWNEKWVKSIKELKRNNEFRTAVLKEIEEEGKKK